MTCVVRAQNIHHECGESPAQKYKNLAKAVGKSRLI